MYLKLLVVSILLICPLTEAIAASTLAAGIGELIEVRPRDAAVPSTVNLAVLEYHYELYGLNQAVVEFQTKLNELENKHFNSRAETSKLPTVKVFKNFLNEWRILYGLINDTTASSSRLEPPYVRMNSLTEKHVLAHRAENTLPTIIRTGPSKAFHTICFPPLENMVSSIEDVSLSSFSVISRSTGRHPIKEFYESMEQWILEKYNPFGLLLYGTMIYDGIGCTLDRVRGIQNIEQAKERHVIPALEFIGLHLYAQMEEMRSDGRETSEVNKKYKTAVEILQKSLNPAEAYEQDIISREFTKGLGEEDRIKDHRDYLLDGYAMPYKDMLLTLYKELKDAILKEVGTLRPHPRSEEITVSLANSLVSVTVGVIQAYNGSIPAALSALGGTIVTGGLGAYRYMRSGKGTLWFIECCCRSRCRKPIGIGSLDKDVFEDRIHEIALHQTLRFGEKIPKMSPEQRKDAVQALSKIVGEVMALFTNDSLSKYVIRDKKIREFRFS